MIKCPLKVGILSFENDDPILKNEFCQCILVLVKIYIGEGNDF